MIHKCPDDEQLADYLEGRLPADLESQMDEHLSTCDICLEEVVVTRNLAQAEMDILQPVPDHVTRSTLARLNILQDFSFSDTIIDQVSNTVRKGIDWLTDLVNPLPEAHLMPVRGSSLNISDTLIKIEKTFEKIDTEIEMEKRSVNHTDIRIYVKDIEMRNKIRVTLEKDNREMFSQLLDKGHAVIEDVSFGRHRLIFSRNDEQLGIYSFEITESGHGRN